MIVHNGRCRMCGGCELTMVLDLGDQPPANRYLKKDEWLLAPEPVYPLRLYFCHGCGLVQLLDVVPKEELFSEYPFVSSGVGDTPRHFAEYAAEMRERFLEPDDLVVEIGGNDGVLLAALRDVRTVNIEPAGNVARIARQRGVETINEFFSTAVARRIAAEHGRARMVLANNVAAQIDDQMDLARGVLELLADDGIFVIQAPYLGDIFDTLAYGMIYHEHLSFFAIRPLTAFYRRFGLVVFEYKFVPFQGSSGRIYLGRESRYQEHPGVPALISEELRRGWNEVRVYRELAAAIERSRDKLVRTLAVLQREGKRIAAYGAAAKGMPILNYAGITHELIEFCVDELPQKQGLYTPLSHIPIISPEEAAREEVDDYLLLAWNFREVITAKERDFVRRGGKFIMPIGDIEIF